MRRPNCVRVLKWILTSLLAGSFMAICVNVSHSGHLRKKHAKLAEKGVNAVANREFLFGKSFVNTSFQGNHLSDDQSEDTKGVEKNHNSKNRLDGEKPRFSDNQQEENVGDKLKKEKGDLGDEEAEDDPDDDFFEDNKNENADDVINEHPDNAEGAINDYPENGDEQIDRFSEQSHFNENVTFPRFVDSRDPEGPGEMGKLVRIDMKKLSDQQAREYKDGWDTHQFNEYISKMISVRRNLPDCRSDVCKNHVESYNKTLPAVSIVMIYHNEAWTVLLRSVHSVLSRTPEHLLKEIVLVDDCSDLEHLKSPLDKYFHPYPKVKILRSPQRIGLIKARLMGFEASTAPVVIFLDSHIECFPGWVETPLIRISENPQAVVFPLIEIIMDAYLEIRCSKGAASYGGFDWTNLIFQWMHIPQREKDRRKSETDPYRSPTMPGGLFAISREFFEKVGKYDPELNFWGGENIELSFKTWMCGGSLELDTCSRVGHLYRKKSPIPGNYDDVIRNTVRVAEVWMDDFKNYFYESIQYDTRGAGDVSSRKKLRENLHCQSFDWYLKTVYPELTFPYNFTYAGTIRSDGSNRCLDRGGSRGINSGLQPCYGKYDRQVWYMNDGQIQKSGHYLCHDRAQYLNMKTRICDGPKEWEYRQDRTLFHPKTGNCLTTNNETFKIFLAPCTDSVMQKWHVTERRKDLIFPKK